MVRLNKDALRNRHLSCYRASKPAKRAQLNARWRRLLAVYAFVPRSLTRSLAWRRHEWVYVSSLFPNYVQGATMAKDLACWQLSLYRMLLISWQWAMPQKEADLRHYPDISLLAE